MKIISEIRKFLCPNGDDQFSDSTLRTYVAEELEARVLFSAAPVDLPDQTTAHVETEQVAEFECSDTFAEESQQITATESGLAEEFMVTLNSFENLSEEEIQELASEAADRWVSTGLSAEQLEALNSIEISVVDLQGLTLGTTEGTDIFLDWNAAGRDWFIDETPWQDEEFEFSVSSTVFSDTDGEAQYGMDMLSVMMHEMGHVLGLEDVYAAAQNQSLMYGGFSEGERRLPVENQAEGAQAGTIYAANADQTVTNLDDHHDTDASITLREAIDQAADGDTLTLAAGTFELGSGQLTINDDITIVGAGKGATFIDANQLNRVFNITSGAKVTFQDLTITGGYEEEAYGGGIYNNGATLTLINVGIDGNEVRDTTDNNTNALGGGIYNSNGTIVGTNVDFTNNKALRAGGAETAGGGGLFSSGGNASTSLVNSTFSNNVSREGGAIYVWSVGARVELEGVTIEGNTAYNNAGGIKAISGTTLDIAGSYELAFDGGTSDFTVGQTITGGTSGATATIKEIFGGEGGVGSLQLSSVSGIFTDGEAITDGSGGSAAADGTLNSRNSQLTNNVVPVFDLNYDGASSGSTFQLGETVTGSSSGATGTIVSFDDGTSGTLSLLNVSGTFTNNETLTGQSSGYTALANGSGSVAGQGGAGRFEAATVTISGGVGGQDLRIEGNSASSVGGGFYNRSESEMTISDVTITNNEANDGAGFYQSEAGSKITGTNITITNNTADTRGGGFRNSGVGAIVDLTDSIITQNTATEEYGGGFYNNGTVQLDNTDIVDNTAIDSSNPNRRDGHGGGFYNASGIVTLENGSDITSNEVWGYGGGFVNDAGTVSISDGEIDENSTIYFNSSRHGGGFWNRNDGIVNLENVSITDNFTGADTGGTRTRGVGGGFYNTDGSTVNISGDSIISGNRAEDGGGFYSSSNGSAVNIIGTAANAIELENNEARVRGGGFRSTDFTTVNLSYVSITDNLAETERGGGFYVNGATVTGDHVTISGNETIGTSGSRQGGAGWLSSHSEVTLTDSTVTQNSATSNGGGFYLENATLNLERTTIEENYSRNSGGGLMVAGSSKVEGVDSSISENIARDHGGGMYVTDDSTVNLLRTQIDDNLAGYESDGVTRRESGTSGIGGTAVGDDLRGGGFRALGRAQVTLTDSTVNGNEAARYGGGFDAENEPVITLLGTTIAGNVSSNQGGAIRLASNAHLYATNSTISGNYAGFSRAKNGGTIEEDYDGRIGGGIWSQSSGNEVILNHVTIADNHVTGSGAGAGGGVYRSGGNVVIENSIIYGNIADAELALVEQDAADVRGNAVLKGANILGVHSSGSLSGDVHNRITDDPGLLALTDNGGATLPDGSSPFTHALAADSPAKNKAIDSRLAVDALGNGRISGSTSVTTAVIDIDGAKLLTDSLVTMGVRPTAVDGASLDIQGHNPADNPSNETLFDIKLADPGVLQDGDLMSVTVTLDYTRPATDHDPSFQLLDGTNALTISMSDNNGTAVNGNGTLLNGTMPANGNSSQITFTYQFSSGGNSISAAEAGQSATNPGTTGLHAGNGLTLRMRGGNDSEPYQVDHISISYDVITATSDIGAFEADPVTETLILDEVNVPQNAITGDTVDLSALATTTGAGPVEYTWAITDSTGNPIPGTYTGANTGFSSSNAPGELVETFHVVVTATDTTTSQTVVSDSMEVKFVNPDISTGDMTFVETIVVDKLGDELDGDTTIGNVTLREAISAANASAAGNFEIIFDSSITDTKALLTQMTYKELNYDNQSAEFTIGTTLSSGGTTAEIIDIIGDGGSGDSTGRLVLRILTGSDFSNNTTITDNNGGSALANGSLFQSYNTGYDYDITKTNGTVVIRGNGSDKTIIDGNGVDRVFDIRPGASVIFEELTITGGVTTQTDGSSEHGGGVKNEGGIGVFHNVDIVDNTAAAGTDSASGGGIFTTSSGHNVGMIFINGGHISNNKAESNGGGIQMSGSNVGENFLYIDGTVISDNTAAFDNSNLDSKRGGGIYITDDGNRAVFNDLTIADNLTAGRDYNDGGGIAVGGADHTVVITGGSIVRNQAGGTSGKDSDGGGFWVGGARNTVTVSEVSIGGDLAGGAGSAGIGTARVEGNIASDDGGGFYIEGQDHRIEVIDSTIIGNESEDNGGGFYLASGTSTLDLTQTATGTLAILNNFTSSGNGYGGGFWNYGNLNITGNADKPIEIKWNEARGTTNNQDVRGGGFWNSDTGVANLTDVRIEENQANRHGAGFWNSGGGTVNIDSSDPGAFRSTISDNKTVDTNDGDGGGFYNTSNGSVTSLTDVVIDSNETTDEGGGFYNSSNGSTVNLVRTDITNNTSQDNGGGFFNASDGSKVTVDTVLIDSNTAATEHGGGFRNDGMVTGNDLIVTNNVTQGSGSNNRVGGGIYNSGAESVLDLQRVTISGNTAYGRGGGLYNTDGTISLTDFVISDNVTSGTANAQGGGIWNSDRGTITLENGEISGNDAYGHGGGIFQQSDLSEITATNVTISGNRSGINGAGFVERSGGGIYLRSSGTVELIQSTVSDNQATQNGGGIYRESGTLTIENSIVFANERDIDNTATDSDTYGNASLVGANIIGVRQSGTLSGTAAITTDPGLGTLADNGGFSQTHSIDASSVAAAAAVGSTTVNDQRGTARDANADIGAFEVVTTVYVDNDWAGTPEDSTIEDGDSGTALDQPAVFGVNAFASIQAAIDAVAAGGTIIVNGGTYGETISLSDGKTIEVTGPDSVATVAIDSLTAGATESIIIEGSSTLSIAAGNIVGDISGDGELIKTGTATLILSGDNNYTGQTTVSGGRLELASDTAVSATSSILVEGSSSLQLRNVTVDRPITLNSSGAADTSGSSIHVLGGSESVITGLITLNRSASIKARIDANTSLIISGGITANGNHNLSLYDDASGSPGIRVTTNPIDIGTARLAGHGLTIEVAGNTIGSLNPGWGQQITLGTSNAFTSPPALVLANTSHATGKLDLAGYDLEVSSLTAAQNTPNAAVTSSSGSPVFTVTNSSDHSFGGVLTGSLSLSKGGAGTLTLTGDNTYSGSTSVTAGTLQIGDGTNDGAIDSDVTISSGATLLLSSPSNNSINDSNSVTIDAGGFLDIREWEGFSGLSGSGTVTNGGTEASTLQVGSGGVSTTFSGVIEDGSGKTSLIKYGGGTLTLNGDNTYTGTTTVEGGILQMGHTNALGANGSTANGTVVEDGAAVDLNGLQSLINERFTIHGDGIASDPDNGAIFNSGASMTSRGELYLILGSDASIGNNGGRFDVRTVSGAYTLTKVGTNDIWMGGSVAVANVIVDAGRYGVENDAAMNDITGTVTVNSGAALATWSNRNLTGDIILNDARIMSSTGAGNNHNVNLSGTITLNGTNNRIEVPDWSDRSLVTNISSAITGTGALIKTGGGVLNLNGDNDYSGGTTVSDGTLFANNTSGSAAGSGNVTVNSGAALGGTGTIAGAVIVNSGGALEPGVDSLDTLTIEGGVTIAGSWEVDIDGTGAGDADTIAVTGDLNLNGSTLDVTELTTADDDSYIIATYTGTRVGEVSVSSIPAGYVVLYNDAEKQVILTRPELKETGGFDTGENIAINGFTLPGITDIVSETHDSGAAGDSISGVYGNLVVNSDGSLTYSLVDERVDPLDEGDAVTDTFYLGQTVVADYRNDFNGSTPAAGWEYLWNAPSDWDPGDSVGDYDPADGAMGDSSSYIPMSSVGNGSWSSDGDNDGNNSNPDRYVRLHATGGHPGAGPDDVHSDVDRFAIAAYTVTEDGYYTVTDSFISRGPNYPSDGDRVSIYVNDTLINSVTVEPGGNIDFDSALGELTAGDTIYIGVGTNGSAGSDGFSWDFSIRKSEILAFTVSGTNDAPIANDDSDVAIEAGGSNNGDATTVASGNVIGGPITVTNPGFEDSDLTDGEVVTGTVTGWQITGGTAGTADRNYNDISASLSETPDPADGEQVAFSDGGDLYQVLGDTLEPNTTYRLSVDVGERLDRNTGTPVIRLGTGSTFGANLLTGTIISNTPAPEGGWSTFVTEFTTGSNSADIGDALRIELVNDGAAQVVFDNVRLTTAASDTDVDNGDTVATGSATDLAVVNVEYSGNGSPFQTDNPGGGVNGPTQVDGQYGTLLINPDGSYTYTPDNDASDILNEGETATEVFSYQITDYGSNGLTGGVYDLVPEASQFTLVYDLPIPSNVNASEAPIPYAVDNSANIDSFSRIGYYLELDDGTESQWVFVTMDAFTSDASQIGLPHPTDNPVAFQEFVSNMNVYASPNANVTTGTGLQTGNIEFWPSNYGGGNSAGVPNADAGEFDFGDGGFDTSAGHGSFQIHNYDTDGTGPGITGETILAFNAFGVGTTDALGIGTNTDLSGNVRPDWTFANNAGSFVVKNLQVFVMETAEATLNIEVQGINDAPKANNDTDSITENGLGDTGEAATVTGNVMSGISQNGTGQADTDADAGDDPATHTDVNVTDVTFSGTTYTGVGAAIESTLVKNGAYGTLTLAADGTYTYELIDAAVDPLDDGDVATEEFTYTILDGDGGSSSATITITVHGTNDAPIASGDTNSIVETGGTTTTESATTSGNVLGGTGVSAGDVADTDVDEDDTPAAGNGGVIVENITYSGNGTRYQNTNTGGTVSGATQVDGQYGTLTIHPDGSYTYELDDDAVDSLTAGENATEVFTYQVTDVDLDASGSVYTNAPEAAGYSLVYDLAIPDGGNSWNTNTIPYSVDRSDAISDGSFDRVGYYLELDDGAGNYQWVFVTADAFTNEAGKLGVPSRGPNGSFTLPTENFELALTNMNVASNTVANRTGVDGSLEFWSTNYTGTPNGIDGAGTTPGGTDYDFDDTPRTTDHYGSMQIHDPEAGETLLAYNRWGDNSGELGIGNRPTGASDWTLSGNAGSYTVKNLQVFVRQTSEATLTINVTGTNDDPIAQDDGGPFTTIWQLGTDNNLAFDNSEFAHEAQPDEHYYFAGNYTVREDGNADLNPITDEDTKTFDRAVTNTNPVDYIHFNLSDGQLNDEFQLVIDTQNNSRPGGISIPIEISVNGNVIYTFDVTNSNGTYTSPVFSGLDAGMVTGDNVIEIRRTDTSLGGFMQYDAVRLENRPVYQVTEDASGTFSAEEGVLQNDIDVDIDGTAPDDAISVTDYDVHSAAGGLVTVNPDGSFSYNPFGRFDYLAEGETATDTFSYTVTDSEGASDTATVTVTINGVNDDPAAVDDGTLATIWQIGSNNGSTSEFEQEGGVNAEPGNPNARDDDYYFAGEYGGSIGTVSEDESVNDGIGGSSRVFGFERALLYSTSDSTNRIHFNLEPGQLNDDFMFGVDFLPIGGPNTGGVVVQILFNGHEVFNDTITAAGLVTANFNGADVDATTGDNVITVQRLDNNGGWITMDYLTLSAVQLHETDEDTVLNVSATEGVLSNDLDVDLSNNLSVSGHDTTSSQGASITVNSDGSFSYDPNGMFDSLAVGESVTDTFTYTVQDSSLATDVATVTVTINGVNDDLVTDNANSAGNQTVSEGAELTISDLIRFTDFDLNDFDPAGNWSITVNWGDGTQTVLDNSGYVNSDLNGSDFFEENGSLSLNQVTAGAANLGSATSPVPNEWAVEGSHTWYDDTGAPYTVNVTVQDDNGGITTHSFDVDVANVAPTAKDDGWIEVWQVGIENNTQSEFEQEGGTNAAPGSATARDDDYYFTGEYSIGTVTIDEPFNDGNPSTKTEGFERALTGGDKTNRIHFNLDPDVVNNEFRITLDSVFSNIPHNGFEIEVLFNSTSLLTQAVYEDGVITIDGIDGSAVGAVAGENVVTIRRIDNHAGWMQFDRITLETQPTDNLLQLWQIGVNNNSTSEFAQENGNTNAAPGSATVKDDDYYLAGEYPATVGTVSTDENAATSFERALTTTDEANRIHFNLPQHRSGGNFRLNVDIAPSSNIPSGGFDIEIYMNGSLILSQNVTQNGLLISDAFDITRDVNNDNVIEIRRTDSNGGWISFDYFSLEALPDYATAEDGPVLNISAADGVLANDYDPADPMGFNPAGAANHNDPLTVTTVQGVAAGSAATTSLGGTVTMAADGSFSYDPTNSAYLQTLTSGEIAFDTFTYTISDQDGGTDTATVTIAVTGEGDVEIDMTKQFTSDFATNPGGDATDDTVEIAVNGSGDLDIIVNGTTLRTVPADAIGSAHGPHNIVFTGSADNETLNINSLGADLFENVQIHTGNGDSDQVNIAGTSSLTGGLNVTSANLTFQTDATVDTVGDIDLSVAGDLYLDTTASLTSDRAVTIQVDQTGTPDAEGSIVNVLGNIAAGTGQTVSITGGNENDVFNITPSTTSVIEVNGGSPSAPITDGDILNITNGNNPQRTPDPVVEGKGTFSFDGGQQDINYTDIERDSIPTLEIDIPISQRLQPTTLNGEFTDFGPNDTHTLTVVWKDGSVSTFLVPASGSGTPPPPAPISSSTDGAKLTVTSIDTTTGKVEFAVSHTYATDGLYEVEVSVVDSTAARAEASQVAQVYFLAPSGGNPGYFSNATLPGQFTLNGYDGLFTDLSVESLFVTDESGYNLTSPVVNQPARIFFTLGGEVRVVFLTGVENEPEDVLAALNNSIINGTPLDLLDNVLPIDEQEVLQMIAELIRIDVDGVES